MGTSSEQQATTRRCASCGETNSAADESCAACGAVLHPSYASTAALPVEAASGVEHDTALLSESSARPLQPAPQPKPSAPRSLSTGTMVGEYRITGQLGKGGMGTVYAGEQPVIGKKVAIKVLNAALSEDPEAMDRFVAEARAVNTIGHPNIIDIFAFGTFEDGSQYYVMEHLAGRSLATYLEEHKRVREVDALALMPPVLDALESAHRRGIVHRDLKPDNIFMADHPDGGYVIKLLDFGIAKFTEEGLVEGRTRTGVAVGTPLYMSPEQCIAEAVDHRSDIYAIGVILYELFTGAPPFDGRSFGDLIRKHLMDAPRPPSEVIDIPAELEKTILWCLEKDKEDRPANIDELRQALMPAIKLMVRSEQATQPFPEGPSLQIRRKRDAAVRRRSREKRGWMRWVGVFLAVILLGAAGIALLFERAETEAAPAVDTVTLQVSVVPPDVDYQLWVDGEELESRPPVVTIPRSADRAIRVEVRADGYEPFMSEHMPLADGTVPVLLSRSSAPASSAAGDTAGRTSDDGTSPIDGAKTPQPKTTPGSTAGKPAGSSQFKPFDADDI